MENLVLNSNGQPVTNSLLVAQKFERRHSDVIKSIEKLLANEKVRRLFISTTYVDDQSKERPMYIMDRDGFTVLTMGFNGEKALEFKLDYINAFNEMEKRLKEQQNLSPAEMLLKQCQIMVEQEKRISNVENKVNMLIQDKLSVSEELKSLPVSTEEVPEMALRDKVRLLVNKYCAATGAIQNEVWNKVYTTLYYTYHIAVKSYAKVKKNETWIEVAERIGCLDKMYIIVSNLIKQRGLVA